MTLAHKIKVSAISVLIAFLTCLMPVTTFASSANTGLIHHIIITQGGVVLFDHTGVRTGIPTCGQGLPLRWAFDGSTGEGQAKLSMLLTAYSTGKVVTIEGAGSCSVWGDTETMLYIATVD